MGFKIVLHKLQHIRAVVPFMLRHKHAVCRTNEQFPNFKALSPSILCSHSNSLKPFTHKSLYKFEKGMLCNVVHKIGNRVPLSSLNVLEYETNKMQISETIQH
jgi:hypothetical protein